MPQLRLNGPQILELRRRLAVAFTAATFNELLMQLDRKVSDFAGLNDTHPIAILRCVDEANTKLWWPDLLREACNASPDPDLRAFAAEVGFAPDFVASGDGGEIPLKGHDLQLKIEDSGTTFDIVTWRTRLTEIEGRVCRIEFPKGQARGTGFLIGPDLVMTNYHVVELVHQGKVGFDQVVCRFDYKVLTDGASVGTGKAYGLTNDWLVDHSAYSALDLEVAPGIEAPADRLDYAILRLSARAGDDPPGSPSQSPPRRGWVEAPLVEVDLMRNPAINIVQHPDGRPMQIAMNSKAVVKVAPTRVRYTTTTQPGSSGSPCFSADWQWVALHHSGDPKYSKEAKKPEYNQGIPVGAIVALLAQRGKGQILARHGVPIEPAVAGPGLLVPVDRQGRARENRQPGGHETIPQPAPAASGQPGERPSKKRRFSAGESDNSLEIINKWLEDRLGKKGGDQQDTAELRSDFIAGVMAQIREALGIDRSLVVTVRTAFRKTQEYLRPVYTDPPRLAGYYEVPSNQSPFSFAVDAELGLPFGKLECVHEENAEAGMFSALHKVRSFDSERTDASNDPKQAFAPRIDKFWTELNRKLPDLDSHGQICCFFAGRNKDGLNLGERVELQDLIALYFVAPQDFFSEPGQLSNRVLMAGELAEQLFTGIKLISRIDSSLFKLEGLQIVAELLPEFSKPDVALADKIAMAIERFKSHLGRHLIGRQQDGQAPNVFYLAASFEQTDPGFFPRLEMYPHIYRLDHVIGSFQVAHRWIPSATKLLLYKYLTSDSLHIVFGRHEGRSPDDHAAWHRVKVSDEFGGLFASEALGTPPLRDWIDRIWTAEFPDLLHMVSHDEKWRLTEGRKSPWKALNRPADPRRENNSIVAFVVEGELLAEDGGREKRTLPRGIFAIESEHIDAFSDDDLKGLREVFVGLAALVRRSTHRNSPLDYRNKVANAFEREPPPDSLWAGSGDENLATRFIFAAQKLDGRELEKLCLEIEGLTAGSDTAARESALAEYGLSAVSFKQVEEIRAFCEGYADSSVDDKRAAQLMELRKRSAQAWLANRQITPDDADRQTVEFLEAVTENFAWSGFLSSLSQALGDRVNRKVPEFRFMAGGYSAARMFTASLHGELRQVVKLSTKQKLERERNNYADQVRYRVVNAARISVNGFAFDTQGEFGRDGTKRVSGIPYGALVSDLVSGRRTSIVTLLSAVAGAILNNQPPTTEPYRQLSAPSASNSGEDDVSIEDMAGALDKLFRTGMIHWRESSSPIQGGATSLHLARQAFRLPKHWIQPISDEDKAARARREDLNNAQTRFALLVGDVGKTRFKDAWEMKRREVPFWDRVIGIQSLQPATIHGDLNSRNLTWSSELKSFFMIDFEHVGQWFFGVDQFRLLVNLVTETFEAASTEGQNEDDLLRLMNEIDQAVKYLWRIARVLFTAPHKGLGDLAADTFKTFRTSQLCTIISTLLNCVELGHRAEHLIERNRFWSYVLFCAALKEFEYSCRSTEAERVEQILTRGKGSAIYRLNAAAIRDLIENISELRHETNSVAFSNYFRHFTAARLLWGIIEPDLPPDPIYSKLLTSRTGAAKGHKTKGRNGKSRHKERAGNG
jgi:V8-like Glu-specific endopeptidase